LLLARFLLTELLRIVVLLPQGPLLAAAFVLVAGLFAFVFHTPELLHKRPACSRTAKQSGGHWRSGLERRIATNRKAKDRFRDEVKSPQRKRPPDRSGGLVSSIG